MKTNLPIIAALTPDAPPAVPEGATVIESRIVGGLPHVVPLLPRWQAVLALPTGTARGWLDMPAETVIDHGAPRLRFQLDRTTRAVVPLVHGPSFIVVDAGSLRLEVLVLDWAIHAGDMVGPANLGSFIRLAVRAADKAANTFGPVPPSDFVIQALPAEDRTESRSGTHVPKRYKRRLRERERRARSMVS